MVASKNTSNVCIYAALALNGLSIRNLLTHSLLKILGNTTGLGENVTTVSPFDNSTFCP